MRTDQGFSYTGSSDYDFNNVELNENQVALFDTVTGIGGIDYMPYDGSTVTVKTGLIGTSTDIQDLQPTLNNKVYYLVTDIDYTDKDKNTIISLATEIPVSLVGGRYEGTFVFNNPNDYPNLYLIWDYTDNMDTGVASYSGGATTRYIKVDYGTDIGRAELSYNITGSPTRVVLEYNNGDVADTGYVGLNSLANYNALIALGIDPDDIKLVSPYDGLVNNGSGNIDFSKFLSNVQYAYAYVYSPLASSSWVLTSTQPSLTSFYIDTTDGTLANVCSQTATTQYWHNGIGTVPTAGDTIYTDSIGSALYDGGTAYHLVNETSMMAPPVSGGRWVYVNSNGLVISNGGCDCNESAVPYIYQDDIYVTENNIISVRFAASNNPTSWNIVTTCNTYELTGGGSGSLYSYVDCNGNTVNETVNINGVQNVCASSVSLIQGDGVSTLLGACQQNILPTGLSFDVTTGILSGSPSESCDYDIEVEATNCVGDSIAKTIKINVETGIKLTPFAIDVENIGDTGDAACAVSPVYTLLYHNGIGRIPDVNDTIFIDYKAEEKFMGGGMWYKIDNSTYSIKICETGNVCEKNECPTVTTTTTSTTTTTTTTTLPTGDWFEATLCSEPSVTEVLVDPATTGFIVGDIVKTTDGNCWEITATTTASYPYVVIDHSVGPYVDCDTCLNITTTTTTTTTTTAPVYTSFMITSDPYTSSYNACMNDLPLDLTLYHNGPSAYPVVNNFVYSDSLGTTPFNGGSSWYYMYDGADYAIQIATTGQVLSVIACAGVTTTTTTTTIPTQHYNAKLCSGGPFVELAQQSYSVLSSGTIVKADNGLCYVVDSTKVPGTPLAYILFTYEKCSDCTGITTTTTTTSTTTSTTTTSTTTTTTTTLPPIIGIFVRKGTEETVCNDIIIERYVDGPLGNIGSSIYELVVASYVLAPAAWYKLLAGTVAYEWDGSNWTGNSITC